MDRYTSNSEVAIQQNNPIESWLSGWVSPVPTTNQGTDDLAFQRWFHFKEAFSPSFVVDVIKSQPAKPKIILDPFSGSGTTALTSQFYGISPIAIEVNPFLADLTETKLSILDAAELLHAKRAFVRRAKRIRTNELLSRFEVPPTFIEPGVNNRWLFNEDVALKIFSYRAAIEELEQPHLQRYFRLALASVLVEASNAIVNGKGRRYRRNWEQRVPPCVDLLMDAALSSILEDAPLTTRKITTRYTLLRGDAKEQIHHVRENVDLALFSPPYPNSFDYTDVYNIELWMLGYLRSSADNKSLRNRTLRSHVQISRSFEFQNNSKTFKSAYKKLIKERESLWNSKIPEMIGAYFEDLTYIISEIGKKLSENGRIEVVVGDSQYNGVHFSVPTILEELLPEHGLKVKRKEQVRSMRSSAQQGGQLELPETRVTISK